MAASQNPIQGSLFRENEQKDIHEGDETNTSKVSSENLSNQQLKEDASLRPRVKKTSKNSIIDIDEFTHAATDEPKWSHHNLPNIDDLTPALRHYVELRKRILIGFCFTGLETSLNVSLKMQ